MMQGFRMPTVLTPGIKELLDQYKQVSTLYITESENSIHLAQIIIDKNKRKQGLGTEIMTILCDYADSVGKMITCQPSTEFGAISIERLIRFYKRFGFLCNTGRTRRPEVIGYLYRPPLEKKNGEKA